MYQPPCGATRTERDGETLVCVRPLGHESYHADVTEDVLTAKTGMFWHDVENHPNARFGSPIPASSREYYIVCAKHLVGSDVLFWKPNACGYTTLLDEAGVYSYEQALKHHMPDHGHVMVPYEVMQGIKQHVVSRDEHLIHLLRIHGNLDPEAIQKLLTRVSR